MPNDFDRLEEIDRLAGLRRLLRWGLRPGSPGAYAFAVGCVAAALAVRLLFAVFKPDLVMFATYYPAVLLATLIGGTSSGILAQVLGAAIGWLLVEPLLPPVDRGVTEQVIALLLYALSSSFIIWAAEHYRRVIRRLDEEQHYRRLVVDELSHRLRNKLATVQAVLRHELKTDPALRDRVDGRLRALVAADDLLTRSDDGAVDLGDIVQAEFAPYGETRISQHGERVRIGAKPAAMLALVFHELATNAAKYGALARPEGQISISWLLQGTVLTIDWSETGGPAVSKPTRQGFGSKLFRRALEPFHGTVALSFEHGGLQCRIALALETEGRAAPWELIPVSAPLRGPA